MWHQEGGLGRDTKARRVLFRLEDGRRFTSEEDFGGGGGDTLRLFDAFREAFPAGQYVIVDSSDPIPSDDEVRERYICLCVRVS